MVGPLMGKIKLRRRALWRANLSLAILLPTGQSFRRSERGDLTRAQGSALGPRFEKAKPSAGALNRFEELGRPFRATLFRSLFPGRCPLGLLTRATGLGLGRLFGTFDTRDLENEIKSHPSASLRIAMTDCLYGIKWNSSGMALPGKFILPVFFLTLFLGAMILGPLIYFGVGVVWHVPFHRAMGRALMLSAVAALGLFWSRISLARLWPWNGAAWKQLLLGYFIAAVSIQAMLGCDLALSGFTSAHRSAGEIAGRVLLAFVAALLVPPVEETVFRGFLQRELIEGLGRRAGWVMAAAIFALAHFLKVPVELDREPVHLWSSVTAMGAAFVNLGHGIAQPENVGKAANLFLIGLILGGVFLRSGTLWMNAGLHGGWIFGLLLFTGLTRPVDPPYVSFFGGDILSSLSTTVVLLLLGLWLWRFYRHPSISPETGANAP